MADFKWYEQRCFCWSSDAAVQEPSDSQVEAMLETLRADGWEDDPTNENGSGWVNVRRPYIPGTVNCVSIAAHTMDHRERLKALECQLQESLDLDSSGQEPADQLGQPLGDALDAQYPDAAWELTVKGGTW